MRPCQVDIDKYALLDFNEDMKPLFVLRSTRLSFKAVVYSICQPNFMGKSKFGDPFGLYIRFRRLIGRLIALPVEKHRFEDFIDLLIFMKGIQCTLKDG